MPDRRNAELARPDRHRSEAVSLRAAGPIAAAAAPGGLRSDRRRSAGGADVGRSRSAGGGVDVKE